MPDEYYDFDDEPIEVEGYCVRCKETVEIEEPQAVWTRRGMPATRGICPICGGTVFRMGKTELHHETDRPEAVEISGTPGKRGPKLPKDTVYIVYAEPDEAIARQITDDLEKSGMATWLHEHDPENVAWASGVHPALDQCNRMVYILSPFSLSHDSIKETWQFFRGKRKPIVIAQIAQADPPDAIRRSPRFDFMTDYRRAFREMLQALA